MADSSTVVSLRRYPVKSMQGEELTSAVQTERGILGDRVYAIREQETGHIASAKHPRKWGRLFQCRAAFREPLQLDAPLPPVWITLPDGDEISSAGPDVDQVLSRLVGRAVALISQAPAAPMREADRSPLDSPPGQETIRQEEMALAAPVGTFFDYAPVHLLTTTTLAQLRACWPEGDFDLRRFRPNIVIAPDGQASGFVENDWLGHRLKIGLDVLLNLIDPCPRCIITTLAQGDLPRAPGILRALAQHNAAPSVMLAPGVVFPAVAGVYGSVRKGGPIRRGDAVREITVPPR